MGKAKTKHHRKPKSRGGTDDPKNISIVSKKKHEAWHTLFGNKSTKEIIRELNGVWLDPDVTVFSLPTKHYLNIVRQPDLFELRVVKRV